MINIFKSHFITQLKCIDVQKTIRAFPLLACILGIVFLTVSSYIQVPVVTVPINMQTFAVTLIGAIYGWRLAGVTIAAWLINGFLGMPVFSGGACGLHYVLGLTGGYLLSFPFIGMLTGWLINRYWNGRGIIVPFLSILLSNAICLWLGATWLTVFIGVEQAIKVGVVPFIFSETLKAALAAVTFKMLANNKTTK